MNMTPRQKELAAKHGTPIDFTRAVMNAVGEISMTEAEAAVNSYLNEFQEAGDPTSVWSPESDGHKDLIAPPDPVSQSLDSLLFHQPLPKTSP